MCHLPNGEVDKHCVRQQYIGPIFYVNFTQDSSVKKCQFGKIERSAALISVPHVIAGLPVISAAHSLRLADVPPKCVPQYPTHYPQYTELVAMRLNTGWQGCLILMHRRIISALQLLTIVCVEEISFQTRVVSNQYSGGGFFHWKFGV